MPQPSTAAVADIIITAQKRAEPAQRVPVSVSVLNGQTLATKDRPCDAVIMAIVDSWEIGGTEKYRKD